MCRFVDAGRSAARTLARPRVLVPLVLWAAITAVVEWLTPAMPAYRFDLEAARRAADAQEDNQASGGKFPLPLAFSDDGTTLISWHRGINKVRFWNIKAGTMTNVAPTASVDGYPLNELAPGKDIWLADRKSEEETNPIRLAINWRRNKDAGYQLIHWRTGKKSKFVPSWSLTSPSGRLVASNDGNANHLLDLATDEQRLFFVAPTVEQSFLVPISPHCFSDDERYLAGVKDEYIVIVEVKTGAILASLPYRLHDEKFGVNLLTLAPDGKSIAWRADGKLVITDWTDPSIERDTRPGAIWLGWRASDRVQIQ